MCFFVLLAGAIPGRRSGARSTLSSIARAGIVIASLYVAMRATGYLKLDPGAWMLTWAGIAVGSILFSHRLMQWIAPRLAPLMTRQRTAVIVGATSAGAALAAQFRDNTLFNTRCVGFFEDRTPSRVSVRAAEIIGTTSEVARFANDSRVDVVYIALPMSPQPRIRKLLRELHDTTASVYFVPDIFVADFAMAWPSDVNGIPVLAVCETPFDDFNEIVKRASDIVFASLLLLLAAPAMLFFAGAPALLQEQCANRRGDRCARLQTAPRGDAPIRHSPCTSQARDNPEGIPKYIGLGTLLLIIPVLILRERLGTRTSAGVAQGKPCNHRPGATRPCSR